MQFFQTADRAFPALEKEFLKARSDISAGFRVFDPTTRLHSDEARAIGDTWYDLIADTLRRGVTFRLILTDFDPVARPAMHRSTWRTVRMLYGAAEASGHPENLKLTAAMHPARVGVGANTILLPKTLSLVRQETKRLNALPADQARRQLTDMPRLAPHIAGKHPNLRPSLFNVPSLVPTTHHQKVAVFDSKTVYLGGLDLNDRRFDNPDHDRPGEQTWKDSQLLLDGPLAQEAKTHLSEQLAVTSGSARPSDLSLLLRTMSAPRKRGIFSLSPRPVISELEKAHLDRIKSAQQLIYLETQYFRSQTIAEAIVNAARGNPKLQVILLLPGAPEDVAFEGSTSSDARYGEYLQAKCVDMVQQNLGDRFLAVAPAQMRASQRDDRGALKSAPLIYVHAKISIFDQTSAIVSSANLNGRSLRWDTEVGVAVQNADDVRKIQRECLQHWHDDTDVDELPSILRNWREVAQRNAKSPPEHRNGFLLPYPVAPARRFGRNLPGVPEEMA